MPFRARLVAEHIEHYRAECSNSALDREGLEGPRPCTKVRSDVTRDNSIETTIRELARDLDTGSQVTPLLRRAVRLAAQLALRQSQEVLQMHLDGITKPDVAAEEIAQRRRVKPRDQRRQQAVLRAAVADRTISGGIMGHPAQMIEELCQAAGEERASGFGSDYAAELEMRGVVARMRNRISSFIVEAEKAIRSAPAIGTIPVVAEKQQRKMPPMSMLEDASRIVRTLAEYERMPGDSRRGRHELDGDELSEALKNRWGMEMDPDRINDAVELLRANGDVETGDTIGGNRAYEFSSVLLTPGGRFQHEKQMAKLRDELEKERQGEAPRPAGTRVFFGHGRSPVWKDVRDYVNHRLGLPWEEFGREATAGYTTKERLEEMLNNAAFAFIVMTAEDERADGTKVARANVIHEVGLFQGRLGFRKAIVLLEDGCEEFSNIHGVTQIRFEPGNIAAKFDEIRQTLEREGLVNK